jgi:hypothetical protein
LASRKVLAGSIPASGTKNKQLYIYTHMKKVIFTLMIATMFVACSVPTETPVVDSTSVDSTIVSDSTIKSDSLVKDTF